MVTVCPQCGHSFELKKAEYNATCSDCGKGCTVPFQPKEGWAVRCLDCYKKFKEK